MLNNVPKVSIIIPGFNRQSVFERSLQSAFNQNYSNFEIIVIDDGSEPALIIPPHLQSSNNITLIRQANGGAPQARNRGFSESVGQMVIFWDADLIAQPDFIDTLVRALQQNPRASYAYCDFYFGNKLMRSQSFDPDRLRRANYITTASLIRREAFTGFDESLIKFQDWDLWLTLLARNLVGVYVPKTLFRLTPGGTMSAWLPRFAYHRPWKWLPGWRKPVKRYEQALRVIQQKHGL